MLLLTRHVGEVVLIADAIIVTVASIDRGKVKLGIQAPRDVPVYRAEVAPRKVAAPTRRDRMEAAERLASALASELSAAHPRDARGPLPRSYVLACDTHRAILAELSEIPTDPPAKEAP